VDNVGEGDLRVSLTAVRINKKIVYPSLSLNGYTIL
jgi:hypothetical protein